MVPSLPNVDGMRRMREGCVTVGARWLRRRQICTAVICTYVATTSTDRSFDSVRTTMLAVRCCHMGPDLCHPGDLSPFRTGSKFCIEETSSLCCCDYALRRGGVGYLPTSSFEVTTRALAHLCSGPARCCWSCYLVVTSMAGRLVVR